MMFSLRIVNVDSYQSAPTKGYDICYSEFRGSEIFKVPIIRIFGITPAGQKGCLHVHGVFPYFSIRCKDVFPNVEAKSLRKYLQELALDIDKALNVASRSTTSHRHHVYKIVITEQIPFYGFHEKAEEFLKIYFYNPFDISRAAELMTNGVILNKFIQPYEAHISYILQFFIDYNLFGMNLINVSKFKFRASESDFISAVSPLRNQSVSHAVLDETIFSSNKLWTFGTLSSSQISSLPRQTMCELELDCCSSEIMNRLNESFSSGKNPGLLAIWEEERQRRKSENETSQITPVPSQERTDFFETESENFYKKKLRKILESFDMYKTGPKEKFENSLKDSKDDLPLSNASDLSTTQDEELLNMMLSMVNSQASHLDDDSILGLNHETENQSESIDDETLEMSQLFTGELEEEIWSSQLNVKDTKNCTGVHAATNSISGQSVTSSATPFIPQLDGAFDQEPHPRTNVKKSKKKVHVQNSTSAAQLEASLIKSCQLMTPVVQLTSSIFLNNEAAPSPAESKPEINDYSQFLSEDSSNSSHKNPFQLFVPVSKNARCSLIMNIYEGSNDVNIEHTCDTRNDANDVLVEESEDPSDVVFEVITNLIYKVECLTDSRNSCYEHLTEEYQGESYSKMLFQGLSAEEKKAIYKLKEASSRPCDKNKKEFYNETNFSLPLKKRTYNYNWDRTEFGRCNSCSHSLSVDFSKIGKEVVVLRKLSESDFVNNVKLQELKVVIPPLSLPSSDSLLKECVNSINFPSPVASHSKNEKLKNKNISKSKIINCDINKNLPADVIENVTELKKDDSVSDRGVVDFLSSHLRCSPVHDINEPISTNTSVTYCIENEVKLNQNKSNLSILGKDSISSDSQIKNLKSDASILPLGISDLRLYRRRKSAAENITLSQIENISLADNKAIQSTSHPVDPSAKNNMICDLQDYSEVSTCTLKSPDPTFLPIVQLKPCNDLIYKYCKSDSSESDDCLIVAEFPQKSENLSRKRKIKRLSRSRVKVEEIPISNSSVVNICTVELQNKSNSIIPKEDTRISMTSDSDVNIPVLRKRSTSSDIPSKKKVGLISKSKDKSVNRRLNHNFESSFVNSLLENDNGKLLLPESASSKHSSIIPIKKDVRCKLSLKLNKKKFHNSKNNSFSEYEAFTNHDVQKISLNCSTNSSLSLSSFKKDDYSNSEKLFLAKKLKKYHSKEKKSRSFMSNINTAAASNLSVNWSIDDIPISQLRNSHALKCTISKKKQNGGKNLHVFTHSKPPIPKFKMKRKRSSEVLNLNIKLGKHPNLFESDPDFKPGHYVSPEMRSSGRFLRNSQTFTSAHDIKQKYKMNKKGKKYRALHHNKSPNVKGKEKNDLTVRLKCNSAESSFCNKKADTIHESNSVSVSSYNSNSTPRNETSDFSNLSPFADDNSNDSRRSKNSLKLKLKLKRIFTRSNEERIVVVGKELEGINEESSDEEQSHENNVPEPEQIVKPISFKKLLGTKNIKYQRDDFSLKAKFKCPLVANKKSTNTTAQQNLQLGDKIPKLICKPLLASISKDLLPITIKNSKNTPSEAFPKTSLPNFSIISPKKQSPLKNAESVNRELAELSKMLLDPEKPVEIHSVNASSSCAQSLGVCLKTEIINPEDNKIVLPSNRSNVSPTHSRLRERKPSTCSKIAPRRNSLKTQDFKKYFVSDDEKSASSEELILKEDKKCFLPDILLTYKPCKVELEKLSPLEIDKYIQKPLFKPHNTEKILICEPSVLSVPSPIVDIKGCDPYIDPTKLLENIFNFPFACNSPLKYNKFESSPLRTENDKSLEPFSNDNSDYFKKATQNVTGSCLKNQVKRPCDVFKSVEREDMGILWNLGYLSPISDDSPLGSPPSCFSPTQGTIENFADKNKSYEELDELQKLACKANKLCSELDGSSVVKRIYSDVSYDSDHLPPYNWLESDAENSHSIMSESIPKNKNKNRCVKNSKTSFQNILQENELSDNMLLFDQKSSDISKPSTSSDANDNNSEELKSASSDEMSSEEIKEENCKVEEPMFEPLDPLPNVRILDFQECLIESDSEMNPLLNDSEIESVMNSDDLLLLDSINAFNYEPCIQADLTFENSTLSLQTKPKCAPEEPKIAVDDVFINTSIDSSFQKTLETDLSNNNAIITAADTSSLLISSFKNNSIPLLAINNPCQDESTALTTLDEQSVSVNNQFFPIVLAPIPVADNANYQENCVKESIAAQDCVNFLEDNELLQSCSVSSTSDIENRNTQASNVLGIPFNGEEDILSMIVKSCDIGEEFDMNMNSVDEIDCGGISSVAVDNSLIESNYILTEPEFVHSQIDKNHSFNANSENAVSSSSEKNLSQKQNSEIVVIKTEPMDVSDVKYVCEFPNKTNINSTDKNLKSLEELGKDDSVLLDSMIQSFYGDDSLYGLNSSVSCDNLSLICPTFQDSVLSQDMQKLAVECSLPSNKSCIKVEGAPFETNSFISENFPKIFPELLSKRFNEKESFQSRSYDNKVPLEIQNSLFVGLPLQKSSKRFHFTPTFKPPTRDMLESSVFKIELEGKITTIDEDSISSDSCISSETCVKDISLPSVFNKASLYNDEYLDSQRSYILSKKLSHLDNNSPTFFKGNLSKLPLPFNEHLISTPSTSNIKKCFPLPDVVISPINKESVLTRDISKRKRKLVFEDDSRGTIKMFKPEREMFTTLNKYRGNNTLNQSLDTLGNLSYSQIEGPSLENSRGFKVGSDNYGDARVRHEVQHLTVMSLEIHVNTRNDLRPDPKFDSVTAIFYCIYNDIGVNEEEEIVGMIVVDPSSHQTTGQNSSDILRNYLLLCPGVKNGFIYCVENEMSLFDKLIRVIREWDPDILVGYEIQMSSWGYLVERAEMLNINLRVLISRLIDKNEMKIMPIEPDHTVTDQTADLSRLNITGRIILCVWRLMRKEITLNVYTFENVYYHVLHKRTPLYMFHDLTRWFLGSQKEKVIRYYVIRVQGCIHLLEKLDIIGRTSELARLFGIQFYEVLSRGSQFRVESMMLRTAAPMSYIPVSPSVRQRSHSRAAECIPLVLEPESRFYIDPVVVLDFQSLYPSMIIAYNYCFSTCLGRVEHFGKNVPFEFGCTSLSIPVTLLQKLQNDIHISPTGIAFTKSSVRRGILPSMLEEILSTRVMVKQSMKKIKQNSALKKLLDARQMGLKLIANVTYGYTGASFSGRMPNVEVADSIVGKARETLERAIHMIENTSKWRAKVIYGDTDSLFILLPGRSKKQAFEIGQEIADAVTADNPKPVKLKFEKVYLPCVLQTKKRYVGFMFETVDQEKPVFDAKGIETVRRDSCAATAKILEKSLKLLFNSYDVSSVKNYVQKQFSKLLSGRASIIDCIFAKEYRGISGYRPGACVPALEIAKKRLAKDPRSEPRVGERVPYVIVYGFPGLPIIQLVREPIDLLKDINLRINTSYYITRVISPPLERVFNLLGADVKSWYTTLARTIKPTLPMTRTSNQHRGTLSQYFASLSCPSCEKPTFSAICEDCREDLQGTTVTLNEKIRQWERTVDHVTQICGSCTKSGSSIEHCVSVDCPMLYRLNMAKKDMSQAPHLRKLLAHELF